MKTAVVAKRKRRNKAIFDCTGGKGKGKLPQHASLVQLVERRSPKPDVEGSSPSGRDLYKRKKFKWINSLTQYKHILEA